MCYFLNFAGFCATGFGTGMGAGTAGTVGIGAAGSGAGTHGDGSTSSIGACARIQQAVLLVLVPLVLLVPVATSSQL